MHQVPETEFDPKIGAMIAEEIVRGTISRMSVEATDPAIDFDDRIEGLTEQLRVIRDRFRRRDYSMVHPHLSAACKRLSAPAPVSINSEYARDLLATVMELTPIGIDVFEEGESPARAGISLLERFKINMTGWQVPGLVHLSDVVEVAVIGQSAEMTRKLETTAGLVFEFADDVPVVRLQFLIEDLMVWISRHPKTHGKTIGNIRRGNTSVEPVLKDTKIREPSF